MRAVKGKPAVFLDRDGVLTKEKGYVVSPEDMEIFPYVRECIRQIREKGFLAIVVTNQGGIAKGLFTEKTLGEMNDRLIRQTGVDAVYYCPHHPEGCVEGYAGECTCRKPSMGMLEAARKDFAVDMEMSWMVGDRASDILTGKNAGIRTILLESGYGTAGLEFEVEPDYVFCDLRDVPGIL